ncbi:MAG: Gfo/Idh/MocA family oxidoreductase [Clostridia bacterium]|nr:Gfo/Idh/MocA family oxidoreductase [Clostridia bacterium]
MKQVKVGVIGLGSRGMALLNTMLAIDECEVVAVCDLYTDRIEYAQKKIKDKRGNDALGFTDYNELIECDAVEAVVIISSWDMHTRMAVKSMKVGKYTAVEVAGAYDIEDCWQLVRTYEETRTPIMMLENCCFDRFELLTTSLVRAGKLGRVLYCHGAYTHELRDEVLGGKVNRHYRLENYIKRNCENYPTHELGPIAKILNITRGNKLISLTSVATKPGVGLSLYSNDGRSPDKSLAGTEFNQSDIVVTTLTCAGGEVITMVLDTTLPHTYSRDFRVRGTKGFCEQDTNNVMLEEKNVMHEYFDAKKTTRKYLDSAEEYQDYLPDVWRNMTEEEKKLGHGGMDYIEFKVFFDCVLNNKPMPIDVYDMATWMSITPLSEQSIAHGGMPQAIPDFTRGEWLHRAPCDVIELPRPEDEGDGEVKNFFGKSRGERV